jgi:molecular chaperone DnaK (HSP70)
MKKKRVKERKKLEGYILSVKKDVDEEGRKINEEDKKKVR